MTAPLQKKRIRDWEINPVLLKELRQAMRSQALTGTLLLLLGLLFLSLVALVAKQSALGGDLFLGRQLCRAILVILSVATFLFLPLYTGLRLAAERQEPNIDLLFFTTLPAGQIVRGKLFSGTYLTAMFFSVCTPFMLFSTLLKGVDIPTILIIAACLYGAVCLAIQAAIFLACLPLHPAMKGAVGVLFFLVLAAANFGLVLLFFELLEIGVGGSVAYWLGFATPLLLALGGIKVLHSMSVTLITADSRPRGYFNEIIREAAP